MSMSTKGGLNVNGGASNRSTMYSTKSGVSDGDGADSGSSSAGSPNSLSAPLITHGRGAPRASGLRQQLTGDTEDDEEEEDETPSQEARTASSRGD